MAFHAEHSLSGSGISEVLDLLLAIPTSKATSAIGLVPGQDGEVFDFVSAGAAAVRAIVADEGAVAKQKEVCVRVEKRITGVAPKAIYVPSMSG